MVREDRKKKRTTIEKRLRSQNDSHQEYDAE
jgi:hypothetical protein